MENPFKADIDKIIEVVRKNPTHIIRWQKKEAELKKTPELFLKHLTFFEEDFVFDPDEDIMVYPDFNYPLPPPLPGEPPEYREKHFHRHEFFEMFYVYSGVCICSYNNKTYTLAPGSLWIFNTRCAHTVHNIGSESLIINIMVRRRAFLSDLFAMLRDNEPFLEFFLDSIHSQDASPNVMHFDVLPGENSELYLFSLIREYYQKQYFSQKLMLLMFASLLTELLRKYKTELLQNRRKQLNSSEIIAYISDHWNTVTLEELSRKLHYSQSYLSKSIQRATGMSFSDYIQRLRLERAANLLLSTRLPIEEIAEMIGYSQRSSFEKVFKKYWGKTPKMWRNNKTDENTEA